MHWTVPQHRRTDGQTDRHTGIPGRAVLSFSPPTMQQSLHLRSTNSAALFSTMSFDSSFGGSSINPSWDPDTMPAWNKTTECQDWSEDWHPCAFPYSGLSGYAPSATYCDTLFSEAFPDAYLGVHIFFLLAYSLLALLYGCRVLLCQVDLNRLPTSPPFAFLTQRLRDTAYRREPKPNKLKPGTTSVAMNVYDFCNCFMLVTAVLQVILSCDVEGWSDLIPYKVHVTLGVISQVRFQTDAAVRFTVHPRTPCCFTVHPRTPCCCFSDKGFDGPHPHCPLSLCVCVCVEHCGYDGHPHHSQLDEPHPCLGEPIQKVSEAMNDKCMTCDCKQ